MPEDTDDWSAAAYNQLQTYKEEIPSLLHYNEVPVVSDGSKRASARSRRIRNGSRSGARSRARAMRRRRRWSWRRWCAACSSGGGFSICSSIFIVFEEDPDTGALHKIIAGYHQFHAVNAAVEETVRATGEVERAEADGRYWAGQMHGGKPGDRRAGVVWHTQGSRQELLDALLRRAHHRGIRRWRTRRWWC